jgi:WD40-like Beta Propeller Repeat
MISSTYCFRNRRTAAYVFVLAVLASLSMASAAGLVRVSVSGKGAEGNGDSGPPRLSADGRFTAFVSAASNLVAGDSNGFDDIFVHDAVTGTTTRASVASNGAQPNADSSSPAISGDGRFVVFLSQATNLVAGSSNGGMNVFLRDLTTRRTTCVNLTPTGAQSAQGASDPAISLDGNSIAFTSFASDLVSDDTNGLSDVFVMNRQTHAIERASLSFSGAQTTTGNSSQPSLSADGRFVAFISTDPNMTPGSNANANVYLRDRVEGTTVIVSRTGGGLSANRDCAAPAISADGRFVAFQSAATNIDGSGNGATNGVFIYDVQAHQVERVSLAPGTNGIPTTDCLAPSVSSDGRFVAFYFNDTGNDQNTIWVRDRTLAATAAIDPAGIGFARADGTSRPSISADGSLVGFASDSDTLVDNDLNGFKDAFVAPLAPSVGFALAAYWAAKTDPSVELFVQRTGPAFGPVQVNYTVGLPGDTAIAGYDYGTAPTGAFFWNPGDAEFQSLVISLFDNPQATGSRSFTVTLSSPEGAVLGIAQAVATITDPDLPDAAESAGHKLSIAGIRDAGADWFSGDFFSTVILHNGSNAPSYSGHIDVIYSGAIIDTQTFDPLAARGDESVDLATNVGSNSNGPVYIKVYEDLPNGTILKTSCLAATYVNHHTAPPSGGVLPPDSGQNAPGFVPPSSSLSISGLGQFNENTAQTYHAVVTTNSSGSSTQVQANAVWSASLFQISNAGVFTAGEVTRNTPVTISATVTVNGTTLRASKVVTVVNVPMAPEIVSSLSAVATVNEPFSYRIKAVHEPTSFGATNLPDGLAVNAVTGVISGAATAASNTPITITATNSLGTAMKTLTFNAYAPSPLTVTITGTGTVLPPVPNPDLLDVGRVYTLLAKPGGGMIFDGWHGDITSTSPKLVFTMQPNLTLEARFIPNPFPAVAAAYAALVSGTTNANSGALQLAVTNSGVFTGKIVLGNQSLAVKGSFGPDGTITSFPISRHGQTPLFLSVALDLSGGSGTLTGMLSEGVIDLPIAGARAIPSGSGASLRYTFVIPATNGATDGPAGNGYGTLTLAPTGKISCAGVLNDGTPVTIGGVLTAGQLWPLYAPLYGRGGSISGSVAFAAQAGSDFLATLNWFRPAISTDPNFPQGWPTGISAALNGSLYSAPPVLPGLPATLNMANAAFTLQGGGLLTEISQPIELNAAGLMTTAPGGAGRFSAKLNAQTGLFQGKFGQSANGPLFSFGGVLFPDAANGLGSFKGPSDAPAPVNLDLLP